MPNYQLLAADERPSASGEGITRTTDPRATLWRFDVRFPMGTPMTGTIAAMSRQQAAKFLRNRYPQAVTIKAYGRR
jgi:hypothetical protein